MGQGNACCIQRERAEEPGDGRAEAARKVLFFDLAASDDDAVMRFNLAAEDTPLGGSLVAGEGGLVDEASMGSELSTAEDLRWYREHDPWGDPTTDVYGKHDESSTDVGSTVLDQK
jgi:hypothetical protein